MKFRIRNVKVTKLLEVNEDCTLQELKNKILEENVFENLLPTFNLTLNGKTKLSDDNSKTVTDVGLRSGDLIKIISIEQSQGQLQESSSATHCAQIVSSSSLETLPSEKPSVMSVEITQTSQEQASSSSAVPRPYISPGVHLFQDIHNHQRPPDLLQILFEHLQEPFELLCAFFHTLMLESGFKDGANDDPSNMLRCFHGPSWCMEYTNEAISTSLRFSLTCTTLGPFVLVNGLVSPCENTQQEPLTLQVKSDEFVCQFNDDTKPDNVLAACKNPSKLSRLFKEKIAHAAMNCMREELQLPPIHGLLSMFPELMTRILHYLDVKSLCRVAQACQMLRTYSESDTLWKSMYLRDYKTHPHQRNAIKKAYCEKYKADKLLREERERQRREFEERDIFVGPNSNPLLPGHPPFAPFPGQPSGIIGGEYDRRPTFPFGPFGNNPFQPGANPNQPNPFPVHPTNPDNPLPGSRYDPMYPGGGFRPGRGGGMFDEDGNVISNLRAPTRRPFNRRQPPDMPPFM